MKIVSTSIRMTILMILLCGFIYPFAITAVSGVAGSQANGSIVYHNGKPIGSKLLGQGFTESKFFHGRVSSVNYNTFAQGEQTSAGSGSANLAPSNPALKDRVTKGIEDIKKAYLVQNTDIPTDLLTCSASGLDPNISPQSARLQIPAISKASGISEDDLNKIVDSYTSGRDLGIFGDPRVNVLLCNLEIAKRLGK